MGITKDTHEELTEKIIQELFRLNLCTYYILPLLKINKSFFFNENNFIDSFLSYNQKYIVVQVWYPLFVEHRIETHPLFKGTYSNINGDIFLVFYLPEQFDEDIRLYCEGSYSKMSLKAKKYIRQYSGLMYKERLYNSIVTDLRLQALDRNQIVRNLWEEYLELDYELPEEMDLLERPSFKSYIDLDSLIYKITTNNKADS